MRLYGHLLLVAAGAILCLHGLIAVLAGSRDGFLPVLLGLDAVVLVLAFLLREVAQSARLKGRREAGTAGLLVTGLILVLLVAETGGAASAWFLPLLMTVTFGGLVLTGARCVLLTAVLAALHAGAVWLAPRGLLRDGFESAAAALTSGRPMGVEELTSVSTHTAFLFLAAWIAMHLSHELTRKVNALEQHAHRDPLTGLPNRRAFVEKLRREIGRADRYAWPIAVLVLDLDHFKRVNDNHGHAVGDTVLAHTAQILRDSIGPVDHLARVGGEEFAVAAVAADPNHGAELADRIVRRVRSYDWGSVHPGLSLTVSVGVAALDTSQAHREPGASLSRLLDEADKTLYRAKAEGRDRFCVAGQPEPVRT